MSMRYNLQFVPTIVYYLVVTNKQDKSVICKQTNQSRLAYTTCSTSNSWLCSHFFYFFIFSVFLTLHVGFPKWMCIYKNRDVILLISFN